MSQYSKGRGVSRTLPPVLTGKTEPSFADGLLVSSMTVPPQKQSSSSVKRATAVNDIKNNSGSQEDGARREELERQLKEKERIVKEKDRELREKNTVIKTKEQEIANLCVSPKIGIVLWC